MYNKLNFLLKLYIYNFFYYYKHIIREKSQKLYITRKNI